MLDDLLDEIRKSIARRGYNTDCYGWDDPDFVYGLGFDIEHHGCYYKAPSARLGIPESGPLWDTFRLIGDPIRKYSDVTYWYSITIVLDLTRMLFLSQFLVFLYLIKPQNISVDHLKLRHLT